MYPEHFTCERVMAEDPILPSTYLARQSVPRWLSRNPDEVARQRFCAQQVDYADRVSDQERH